MDWATPYTDYVQGQRDWLQTTGDIRRQRAMDLEYVMSAMEPSIMATRDQRLFSNQLDQLQMQAQIALKQMGLRYILEGAQRGYITGPGVGDALGATGVLPGQLYFMDPVTGQPRAYGGAPNGAPVPQSPGYSMGTPAPDNSAGGTGTAPPGYRLVPVPVPAPGPAPAPVQPPTGGIGPRPYVPPSDRPVQPPTGGMGPRWYAHPSDRPVQPPTQPRRRNNGVTASPAQTLFGE